MKFTQSSLDSRLSDMRNGKLAVFSCATKNWDGLDLTEVNKLVADNFIEDIVITDDSGMAIKHVIKVTKEAKRGLKQKIKPVMPPVKPVQPVAIQTSAPEVPVYNHEIARFARPELLTPNAEYVQPDEWDTFDRILRSTDANIWLVGHAGCGKDEIVKQWCAVNGKRLYQINCRRDMSPDIFFGRFIIEDHNMKFVPGLIEKAMTDPNGGVLFIDEAASMPAEVAISLNRLLEENEIRKFVIDCDGGREVVSTPGFKVILASNTIGRGFEEATASYSAQNDEMDASIHSRISATINMDFNIKFENKVIDKMFSNEKQKRTEMKTFIKSLRKAHSEGFMALPFSTRNLLSIRKLLNAGFNFDDSLKFAYIARLTNEEIAVVEEQKKLCIVESKLDIELKD